jgi:RNA polymerase sigma factor (TIGR02999 family)
MASKVSVTELLHSFMEGDAAVADALLCEVLPELREIARRALRKERYAEPLTRTELINELWLRSLAKGGWQVNDRAHFYALVSVAMRRILVDFARARLAQRRGGGDPTLPLEASRGLSGGNLHEARQIIEIDILIQRLETRDPDAAGVVDMHYFAGFTLEEIARNTGLRLKQVRTRWDRGRNWLKLALRDAPPQTSRLSASAAQATQGIPSL